MFGIFKQKPLDLSQPIFRGFDDIFNMPHSRHTEVRREDIEKVPGLDIIAESPESGVSIVMARNGREFFVTGHLEYAPNTLDKEYKRDMGKRDDVELPKIIIIMTIRTKNLWLHGALMPTSSTVIGLTIMFIRRLLTILTKSVNLKELDDFEIDFLCKH